eukprot:TRINITY_DN11000_c0_g1_i1.p1 TRINITY_DN11000_c0_g1~~TRINITY_DN11000_c0_g1_i1.p1  ORF type:complete len:106 (-),score=26.68 TRINITY_DN11000_c0_g1_i1:448-765(-)
MFVEKFEDFLERSEQLYLSSPLQTRYVIKYRHKEGKLVLKVTDNKVCLKHYIDYLQDIKKIEKLTLLFLRVSTNKKVEPYAAIEDASPMAPKEVPAASAPKRRKK